MDKQLAILLLDHIEKLELENKSLIVLLPTLAHTGNIAHAEALLERLKTDPAALAVVHEQWLPLRQRIESDSSLEEALKRFAQIVPPPKEVN
jgi:proteasome assembly chaperone (PAC2) family protein